MEGRIFAALREDGPLPREVVAERATLDGDTARAARIVRDLIEAERLVPLSGDRVDVAPPRTARERMIDLIQKHRNESGEQR